MRLAAAGTAGAARTAPRRRCCRTPTRPQWPGWPPGPPAGPGRPIHVADHPQVGWAGRGWMRGVGWLGVARVRSWMRFANHLESADVASSVRCGTARIRSWDPTPVERRLAALAEELAELVIQAEAGLGSRLPRQLVHGDFWDDNVLFRHGQPVLVADFDFMGERARAVVGRRASRAAAGDGPPPAVVDWGVGGAAGRSDGVPPPRRPRGTRAGGRAAAHDRAGPLAGRLRLTPRRVIRPEPG
jgi:Phosphotransferase enzyme family